MKTTEQILKDSLKLEYRRLCVQMFEDGYDAEFVNLCMKAVEAL